LFACQHFNIPVKVSIDAGATRPNASHTGQIRYFSGNDVRIDSYSG